MTRADRLFAALCALISAGCVAALAWGPLVGQMRDGVTAAGVLLAIASVLMFSDSPPRGQR